MEHVSFPAKMAMMRICLSVATGLHRQERAALLHAQQIDDAVLLHFIKSIVVVGGLSPLVLDMMRDNSLDINVFNASFLS